MKEAARLREGCLVITTVASLVVFASICWSAERHTEEMSVRVDAAERSIHSASRSVKAGQTVDLVVANPNSFRESYELTLDGVDYHDSNLPASLKGILSVAPATVESLPGFIWLATRDKQGTQERMVSRPGVRLPEALRRPYGRAILSLQDLARSFGPARRMALATPISARLANRLVESRDNKEARGATAHAIEDVWTSWIDKDELSKPADPSDVGTLLLTFTRDTAEHFDNCDEALADWDTDYGAWSAGHPLTAKSDTASIGANQEIQNGRKAEDSLRGKVALARAELEAFVELARVALDPIRVPDEIHRRAPAGGDELLAQVTIKPIMFVEEKRKDLPKQSEVTLSQSLLVHGRWTLDVSAGVLGTPLRHRNFTTAPVDSSGKRRMVLNGSEDEADLSPAAFVHYVRTSQTLGICWAWGPTLGVSTPDPIRYFAGGSLQFGRITRLSLSYGVAWGKVSVLNGDQVNKELVGTSLDTKDVVRVDWGAALSFAVSLPLKGKKT